MTFTSQKPTVPGAYWWKDETDTHLVNVKPNPAGELWAHGTDCIGEWSPRLVPVEEVEKAFVEGHLSDYLKPNSSARDAAIECWEESRARRVVEGKEEV